MAAARYDYHGHFAVSRGTDHTFKFRHRDVDLTGYGLEFAIMHSAAPVLRKSVGSGITMTWNPAGAPVPYSEVVVTLSRAETRLLPQGLISRFEYQSTSPGGEQALEIYGMIEAVGDFNID